jgi:hypothetical protein
MTVDDKLAAIEALIQEDVGNRGLRTDPVDNLITRTAGDFAAACRSIAQTRNARVAILTGFYVASAEPPCGETDGPLGALFLARAFVPLGIRTLIVTDAFCHGALEAARDTPGSGLVSHAELANASPPPGYIGFADTMECKAFVSVAPLPRPALSFERFLFDWSCAIENKDITHLISIERVGPCHADGHCYSMRGRDITEHMAPAHLLLEDALARTPPLPTIGIGDGGNEIGMGKIPREVIARNIANGDKIACRVPTDHLIVAGVSNWGAYGLAAGVRLLRGAPHDPALWDPDRESELLQLMVERGPLVDGVSGKQSATVDWLPWETYASVLKRIGAIMASGAASARR